jgi:hypothetical protein
MLTFYAVIILHTNSVVNWRIRESCLPIRFVWTSVYIALCMNTANTDILELCPRILRIDFIDLELLFSRPFKNVILREMIPLIRNNSHINTICPSYTFTYSLDLLASLHEGVLKWFTYKEKNASAHPNPAGTIGGRRATSGPPYNFVPSKRLSFRCKKYQLTLWKLAANLVRRKLFESTR